MALLLVWRGSRRGPSPLRRERDRGRRPRRRRASTLGADALQQVPHRDRGEAADQSGEVARQGEAQHRTEERSEGKECVRTCRSWWRRSREKKKSNESENRPPNVK